MKYIAITIGPIYKTLQNVRKTRELWAASYIFSYISKRIVEKIETVLPNSVLVPFYNANAPTGIGLYPDRIFLKAGSELNINDILKFKDEVLWEISEWINQPNSFDFLNTYLRIYSIEYEVDTNQNPLAIGNKLLDSAELRSKWELHEQPNLLLQFFRTVNTLKVNDKNWIFNHLNETDVFGQIRFESIGEISTRLLRNENTDLYKSLVKEHCFSDADKDEDDNFITDLKNKLNKKDKPEVFKNYHKYICIVKADGDRVGSYINAIDKNIGKSIIDLSKALNSWGELTAQMITEYKGVPIYIGGDDLLFLAPVVGNNKQNIIDLTANINGLFEDCFKLLPERIDKEGETIKLSLSFGISITYYKFPLSEALNKADDLLKLAKTTRNTSCLSLLKHSGSTFDLSLLNNEKEKINVAFIKANQFFSDSKSFVSSIINHFRENKNVYRLIGEDDLKVKNFLLNNFDDSKYKKFVEAVADLCSIVYQNNSGTASNLNSEESIRELYNMLRILKFLNGQEDDK